MNGFYLSNSRAWLDHLTPSLLVLTYDTVNLICIVSGALEQVIAIHSGMAAERAGLVSSQVKPVDVYSQKECPVGRIKQERALALSRFLDIGPTGGQSFLGFPRLLEFLGS
ncbi:hypothetical protein TNCV_1714221 [Trichonephila clavipes]|nr:hypothetical protein TNCV_1714221 [Trichonephila clavipes]